MAYAVLLSLAQTINQILDDDDQFPIFDNDKLQITSLREHVIFLLEFLQKFPKEASSLEARIRDAANEAEDNLEGFMYDQIRSKQHGFYGLIKSIQKIYHKIRSTSSSQLYDFDELKEVVERINSISREAADVKSLDTAETVALCDTPSVPRSSSTLANEAEDNLEGFMYDQIRSHHHPIRSKQHGFYGLIKSIQKIYHKEFSTTNGLKKVVKKINSISREAARVKSLDTAETVALRDTPSVPRSSSTLAPAAAGGVVTVGLDDDLLKIKDLLSGKSSKLQIIPIVGMGGIGKTTLARKAYHDQLIIESFPIRAWVTVSQDYKASNIFSDLLDFLKKVGDERSGESSDTMQEKVYKSLKGRKYLIVLDDIWSTKAWDDVKLTFPDDGNGSRIVLTTRIEDVASYADSSNCLHQMQFMNLDQSWNLLKQKVFPDKDWPSNLEDIGKDIATSCGGLPLAIVLVAGILSTVNETRLVWLEVAKKVRLGVYGKDGHFEKIISLSYTHLPHHLRPCFLYMAAFPEDYEIRVSKLTKLWIAEGFVEPRAGKSMEEGAEEYLEDLVKRSLALVAKRKSNGKIKSCNVHDLVRDIYKRKAVEENYQRRLSIAHPDPHDLMFLGRAYGSTLRSVICFQPSRISLGPLKVFRLLRVLEVLDINVDSFPAQVCDLFHLRYLAFTFYATSEIPAAISTLRNLRTLIICSGMELWQYSKNGLCLPLGIWMMPLLTHLIISCPLLLYTIGAASTLEKLETLSVVVTRFVCTKTMMEMIPNIKKLGLTYNGKNLREEHYQLHNLVFLRQLEKLKLVSLVVPIAKVYPVFPDTLKKLTLSRWRFSWKFMDIVGSLPNLQVLKLRDHACEGDTWETNEEQFPSLETLYIDGSDLKNWVTESSHFPRLKCLVIFNCYELSEIPDDIGEILTLELIQVDYANKSLVQCVKRIQAEQHDNGNYYLQVNLLHLKIKMVVQVPLKSQYDIHDAFKLVMRKEGVESAALTEDGLIIVGYDIDVVGITKSLRKKYGSADVVSVVGPSRERVNGQSGP